jgi:hypothetical protein
LQTIFKANKEEAASAMQMAKQFAQLDFES